MEIDNDKIDEAVLALLNWRSTITVGGPEYRTMGVS